MRNLFWKCIVVYFLGVGLADDPKCPSRFSYQNDLGICLLYRGETNTWDHALSDCENLDHGQLLSIHNTFQNNLLAQIQFNMTGDNKGWLGARRGFNGTWTWSDGTPLDYERFFQSSATGDCVYLDGYDKMWKITSCSNQHKWLCAAAPITTTTSTTMTTTITTTTPSLTCLPPTQQPQYNCKQGWQYFPQTGYQYMVAFDRNFTNGEPYCVSQGGHLVSIHSAAENDFVSNLCCTSACQTDHQRVFWAVYLTGGRRINGNFVWIDGSPFDYTHSTCQNDGDNGDNIRLMNFQGCSQCGEPGWWQYFLMEAGDVLPYIVCKKK